MSRALAWFPVPPVASASRRVHFGWSCYHSRVYVLDGPWYLPVTPAGSNPAMAPWILADAQHLLVHTAAAVVLSGFLWFGWVLAGSVSARNHSPAPRAFDAARHPEVHARLTICAWTMLLAGVALHLVYSRAYGGLAGILDYSNAIRSGIFEVHNPWTFLKPLTGLALFASFIFYGLILSPGRPRPWLGLVLSVGFSIYLLYSWLGRIGFLTYLATFALGHVLHRGRKPVEVLLLGGAILGAILVGAYYLSAALNLKFIEGLTAYLASELSFPFASFLGHLHEGPERYRWFNDFAALPLYFLPSSLWIDWFDDVSRINTI